MISTYIWYYEDRSIVLNLEFLIENTVHQFILFICKIILEGTFSCNKTACFWTNFTVTLWNMVVCKCIFKYVAIWYFFFRYKWHFSTKYLKCHYFNQEVSEFAFYHFNSFCYIRLKIISNNILITKNINK